MDLHDTCAETWRALGISSGMRNTDGNAEKELKEISLFFFFFLTRTLRLVQKGLVSYDFLCFGEFFGGRQVKSLREVRDRRKL